MSKEKKTSSGKKEFFLFRWIKRAFFPNKELDVYAEEKMQSPARLVARNFFENKLAVTSLVIFIIIALFVFIAPNFVHLDLGEQDSTLIYLPPGYDMLDYPSELESEGVEDLSVGQNYSIACDKNGKTYVWGETKISRTINLKDIPEEVADAKIVKVAAGSDHAVAVDEEGTVYVWGSSTLKQLDLPDEIKRNNKNHQFNIVKVAAGEQYSAVVSDEGNLYLWGNGNFVDLSYDYEVLDGHVKDVALTSAGYVVLTDEGAVVSGNYNPSTAITKVPDSVSSGIVQIAGGSKSVAALKEDGTIVCWGAAKSGETVAPDFDKEVVSISGGRYHYMALLADGTVKCWGSDRYGQSTIPEEVQNATIVSAYSGHFQNYVVDESGKVYAWGLKGFLFGTDGLGRDVFARLVNGGKMTMTIGALSVVIMVIIGLILGGIAGYFGGLADMIIMRVAEVVQSMPFIPFAMILSAVLGTRVSIGQRMYIIMVILGILSWPGLCRLVRAQMLAQREMEYVVAAKALGVKENRIIFSHIMPNVLSVCLVSITLSFGTSMLTESTLSYLGFGVPLPTPTWGNMLTGANNSIIIQNYWWNWLFVGLIFGITCICINLIGDGLRDALDPKANGR
ncbi:MAG: ABC transporter permease subunit [Eubacterium sp.]|jgi:peptide/nickel transport system permease protein